MLEFQQFRNSSLWRHMDAYTEYVSVRRNYFATLMAAKLMLSGDHAKDQIVAHLQVSAGFDPKTDKSRLSDQSADLVEWANEERRTDFQGIRRAYLIGACGALEHLAKCCFVAWVEEDSEIFERIQSKRLSFSLDEYLTGESQDRAFVAADRVFQAIEIRRHFQKFCTYVCQLVPTRYEDELASFKDVNAADFDEAFSVRNRLVHHGARADLRLGQAFSITSGQPLQVKRAHAKRYMQAMDAMAAAIAGVTPPILEI